MNPTPQKGKQKMKETGSLPGTVQFLNGLIASGVIPLAKSYDDIVCVELVRRWNCHEQMREALKKALPYYKLSAVMGDTINQEIAQTIMDALALATPGREGE